MIVGGVVAALLLAGTVGVALGAVLRPSASPPVVIATPAPVPSAAPTDQPVPTDQPAPSAGVTPGPIVTPAPVSATPSPGTGGGTGTGTGTTVKIEGGSATMVVPGDWKVIAQDDHELAAAGPPGGLIDLISGQVDHVTSAETYTQVIINDIKRSSPDLQICLAPAEADLPNGPTGLVSVLCYTRKLESGKELEVRDTFFVGTSDQGSTLYIFEAYTTAENFEAFMEVALDDIAPSVEWKLYSGD